MSLPKHEYLSSIWRDGIFDQKVVFCTGGAGTICSAQVRAMVHLGANACIVGRNVEKTENMAKSIATARSGARVLGIGAVDVRSVDSLAGAVERCEKEIGEIDFVIAGAAGNFLASINQLSPNAFKAVIDIDVLGSYNTLKATLPSLVRSAARNTCDGRSPKCSAGGRIIFISATLHYTGTPLQSHVSVAKAGIDALSNSVSVEFGPRGVTSNIVAPGPIAGTEGMERLARKEDVETSMRHVPMGRYGTTREIADATVYLFSEAAGFVNGQILVVDGGAWRTTPTSPSSTFRYPDFLLSDDMITGVKGMKKSKL